MAASPGDSPSAAGPLCDGSVNPWRVEGMCWSVFCALVYCQLKLHVPFLLRHRSPSHRASGPSPLFRTCLTNLLSLSNIGAAWVSTLESVAPRCPLSLGAQTPGPDGPEPGGMAADGGMEDIRKKRNGQDSFFFNKHLTLHQETPTQYSLSARSAFWISTAAGKGRTGAVRSVFTSLGFYAGLPVGQCTKPKSGDPTKVKPPPSECLGNTETFSMGRKLAGTAPPLSSP